MAFGIEKYKTMQIPIPADEQIYLVPRTLIWTGGWTGEWKDTILVFTSKGIHFRVRKDKMIMVDYSGGANHSLLKNTFLAYDRIAGFTQGSGLWKNTVIIQMVDGLSIRFAFNRDLATVMQMLPQVAWPGYPRNLMPYDYDSHNPEAVPHVMVPAPR